MKRSNFKGGIHPQGNKEHSAAKPIKVLTAGETMVFPMSQHIGAPCEPLVKKGDYVRMYQKIGDSSQFVSSPVHSSVSGEVTAVEPRLTASGAMVMSVVVENDFKDEKCEGIEMPPPDKALSAVVRDAGIVGMGGATFPTHVKLSPPKEKQIDVVIVNGAECEPYITSDHRIMLESGRGVLEGLYMVLTRLGISRGVIAIENNKPDAIAELTRLAYKYESIEIVTLDAKYPQGSEKQLIFSVTGKEVPSGALPMDIGVIVLNVDTCNEIYKTTITGNPLISRIVTVGGPAVKEPQNFEVRLGTQIKSLIESAGGTIEPPKKILMGGPMMGIALSSTEVPVVKGTGAVLCFGEDEIGLGECMPCIRCGRCVTVCPMRIMPLHLCNHAIARNWEACKKYYVNDCIECGACSYVCPSKRQIVQSIRLAKQMIKEKKI